MPFEEDIADELESLARYSMRRCQDFDAGKINEDELPFIDGDKCETLRRAAEELRALRSKVQKAQAALS
ncbi:hypothetical protein [Leisingera caerulea]|uniref:hypothetical protein n=1 Tax=Leisingera caerulea TaxID=506591 RepID=UPI0004181C93|nr:hypothetical protein [Leisingera caerulea]